VLPHGFPPEGTVRGYFHRFKRNKTLENINDEQLRKRVRVRAGRDAEPSSVVIDSQPSKRQERQAKEALTEEKN
jgi:putative transposase